MFLYKVLGVVSLILLTACTNQEHENERDHIANMSPPAWSANSTVVKESNNNFQSLLSEPLIALIEEALTHNNNIQIAAARLERAHATKTKAKSGLFPSFTLRARANENEAFINDGTEKVTFDTYSSGLSASWEVDIWGRVRNGASASNQDLEAQHNVYAAARQSLISTVVITWFEVLRSQQLYELSEKRLSTQQRRLDQQVRRLDQGLVDALAVRLTRNNIANAEANLLQSDNNLHRSLRSFEVLLGRYPNAEMLPIEALPELQVFDASLTPRDILEVRPDVLEKEYQLFAANLRVSEAKKALWPQLKIDASYDSGSGASTADVFNFDYWLGGFSATLLQPVFRGGFLRASVKQQQADAERAIFDYRQTVLTAWEEVENYLYAERILEGREDALDNALTEAQAAEALTLRKYEEGLVSSFELLTAQNRSFNAESDFIRASVERVVNRVRLYVALGISLELQSSEDLASQSSMNESPNKPAPIN